MEWTLSRAGGVALVVAAALAVGASPASAGLATGSGSGGVRLKQVGEFDSPVYVDNVPGSKRLVAVVEQTGRIKLVRGSHVVGHDFLDISRRVQAGGEEGLLSVAFAPDYKQSRRLYVYFTNQDGDNQVEEFKRRKKSKTRANPGSGRTVIAFDHPDFGNHNGGQLQFGPDGLLYAGTGDGGGGSDPFENAQNPNSLLGKLIRIDPRRAGGAPYGVPNGNPFAGPTPGRDEVFALGLRNPWRFSFDSVTHDIVIGDVGQDDFEEVDYETNAKGANFGWDAFEGNHPFESQTPPAGYRAPVLEYSHGGGGCAVTGGYVVRDRKLPTLYGRYVYSDLCLGELRSFIPDVGGHRAADDKALGPSVSAPSSFGEGRKGRIYVASLDGPVYRLK
jgi:glucose/arabinose dehydrogenase